MSGKPSELRNLIREAAEGHQQKPAHILILGVKGMQARIGKPSQPIRSIWPGDKASDFLFLKPLFDTQVTGSWTLYRPALAVRRILEIWKGRSGDRAGDLRVRVSCVQ